MCLLNILYLIPLLNISLSILWDLYILTSVNKKVVLSQYHTNDHEKVKISEYLPI